MNYDEWLEEPFYAASDRPRGVAQPEEKLSDLDPA